MEVKVDGEIYITTNAAAEITGYSINHVRRLARLGQIRAVKIHDRWLVSRKSVRRYKHDPKE